MKDVLNKSYRDIINKYKSEWFDEVLKRGYVFQFDEDEINADLLFIGMNPSYTEKYEKGRTYADSYTRAVNRSYFKPFCQIHQELINANVQYNGIWTHFDLLVFRETNQKFIENLMSNSIGCKFILEQLEIAKRRLIRVCPKVVLVSNAKARELLGKNYLVDSKTGKASGVWMGLRFDFDEEFGSHKVKNIPSLTDTHFLFTSMLSGQRGLDLGSKERLVWQIKRIFRKQNLLHSR